MGAIVRTSATRPKDHPACGQVQTAKPIGKLLKWRTIARHVAT
ncbi:hypothetical protein [Aliiroseovarius sp. Z3]|nr:hypothetical protein [Aliiroseovarius sp. Z3]